MTPEQMGAVQGLVLAAYEEGFDAGASHNGIDWKYPPVNLAWLYSDARKSVGFPPLTDAQLASIMAWESAKADDQHDCDREEPLPPAPASPV